MKEVTHAMEYQLGPDTGAYKALSYGLILGSFYIVDTHLLS